MVNIAECTLCKLRVHLHEIRTSVREGRALGIAVVRSEMSAESEQLNDKRFEGLTFLFDDTRLDTDLPTIETLFLTLHAPRLPFLVFI